MMCGDFVNRCFGLHESELWVFESYLVEQSHVVAFGVSCASPLL